MLSGFNSLSLSFSCRGVAGVVSKVDRGLKAPVVGGGCGSGGGVGGGCGGGGSGGSGGGSEIRGLCGWDERGVLFHVVRFYGPCDRGRPVRPSQEVLLWLRPAAAAASAASCGRAARYVMVWLRRCIELKETIRTVLIKVLLISYRSLL